MHCIIEPRPQHLSVDHSGYMMHFAELLHHVLQCGILHYSHRKIVHRSPMRKLGRKATKQYSKKQRTCWWMMKWLWKLILRSVFYGNIWICQLLGKMIIEQGIKAAYCYQEYILDKLRDHFSERTLPQTCSQLIQMKTLQCNNVRQIQSCGGQCPAEKPSNRRTKLKPTGHQLSL